MLQCLRTTPRGGYRVFWLGEERGLRRLVREACDFQVGIPMARTEVGSLNASVAAGLVLFEVLRQRTAAGER